MNSRWKVFRQRVGIFDVFSFFLSLFFLFVLFYPLLKMFWTVLFSSDGFRASFAIDTIADPGLRPVIWSTVTVVGTASVCAMVIAMTFAWLNERTDASLGWVSRILPFVPLLLPPIALSIGWFFLAHERAGMLNYVLRSTLEFFGITAWESVGPLNIATWGGLVFVYTLYLVPYAYIILAATFSNLDPSLEEASFASGAGRWRTFRRISLPAILPGIAAAALLVAINGLSQFSIPVTIGTAARIDILSVRIVALVNNYPPHYEEAVVISGFVMLVIGALWLIQRWIAALQRHSVIGGKSARTNMVTLGVWKWPARLVMVAYLTATSIVPLMSLFLVSLQRFWQPKPDWNALSFDNFNKLFFGTGVASRALFNSTMLALIGATLGILLATTLLLFVRQHSGSFFSKFVDGSTKAPGAISHIVIGVAFVIALSGSPFNLGGTLAFLLLAYIVIYMPQAAVSVGSGIDQIGKELFDASSVFGAGRGRTFRRVALPLLRPSLAAGWALLFVVMLGDLTASALLARGSNPVVGFVIYDIWENGTFAQLSTIATAVSFVSFIVVSGVFVFAKAKRT